MEAAVNPNAGINIFAKTSAVIAGIQKRKEEAVELVSESGDVGAFIVQSDYKQLTEDVSLGPMLTAEEIQNIQTYSKRKIMAKDILLTVDYAYDNFMPSEVFEGFVFTTDKLYYIKDDEVTGEFAYSEIESVDIENKDYGTIVINGSQFSCSFNGQDYGKEFYNYLMDLLDQLN